MLTEFLKDTAQVTAGLLIASIGISIFFDEVREWRRVLKSAGVDTSDIKLMLTGLANTITGLMFAFHPFYGA